MILQDLCGSHSKVVVKEIKDEDFQEAGRLEIKRLDEQRIESQKQAEHYQFLREAEQEVEDFLNYKVN